jgi:hypothetical protein
MPNDFEPEDWGHADCSVCEAARSAKAALERDELAARLAQAYAGEAYIGDMSEGDWERWYRVVDALGETS